jgi:hypothetical protein
MKTLLIQEWSADLEFEKAKELKDFQTKLPLIIRTCDDAIMAELLGLYNDLEAHLVGKGWINDPALSEDHGGDAVRDK